MAKEIQCCHTTGKTVYALVLSATGQFWYTTGSALETWNAAHYTAYAVSLTEQGTTGIYLGDMPAAAAGRYSLVCREQAAGSPAQSDATVAAGAVEWSGTALTYLSGDAYARLGAPAGASIAADVAGVWTAGTRTLTASLDPSAATIAAQVRTELAVELGRLDAAVSTRLAAASYTAAPSAATVAAAVRTELTTELGRLDASVSSRAAASDLATVAGYLDTEIAAILADTNELQTDWANGGRLDLLLDAVLDDTGTAGVVVAAGSKTGYSLAVAGLDAVVVETGLNARQALSVVSSSVAGVLSGAAGTSITVKGAGVATTRIQATVDADGNRTAVTLTPPA